MKAGKFALSLAVGALAWMSTNALAEDYPSRTVTIVVPFSPGGPGDLTARYLAQKLQAALGQPFVIENRAGANGVLAAVAAARAKPDGYTLMQISSSHTANESLIPNRGYELMRDFEPVASLNYTELVMEVTNKLPVKTVPELIQYAKANPGKLNYASVGNGSSSHLNMELFKSVAGFDAVHIPFNGSPPAVKATVQNETQMMFAVMQPLQAQIKAGALRALAVTTGKRFPLLPDLPTIAESGYPGFEALAWNGVLVAANTPQPIIARLNAEMNAILKEPDVAQKMHGFGFDLIGGTPGDFGALIQGEARKWEPVIKKVGLKVD